jgi:hypothetical protein
MDKASLIHETDTCMKQYDAYKRRSSKDRVCSGGSMSRQVEVLLYIISNPPGQDPHGHVARASDRVAQLCGLRAFEPRGGSMSCQWAVHRPGATDGSAWTL